MIFHLRQSLSSTTENGWNRQVPEKSMKRFIPLLYLQNEEYTYHSFLESKDGHLQFEDR